MARKRSRISTSMATVLVLGTAGGLAWAGAEAAATFVEKRAAEDVTRALQIAGHDWAGVATDGLQVRLTGTAPTEVDRFRAMTDASGAVDASRIVDDMTVAAVDAMTPPDFEIELLSNDQGILLIGLVPAALDRQSLLAGLDAGGLPVTDLLESADYPVPKGWDPALRFGLQAAALAPQAKISIRPGEVTVAALAESREDQGRLEAALQKSRPQGVTLDAQISAPRPVIAPFTLRYVMDGTGPRFDACAAETEEARTLITDAARKAGLSGPANCTLGLGAPSPEWGAAAAAAIETVAALGLGDVTLSDADVALVVPPEVDPELFDRAVAGLEARLPAVFSLDATLQQAEPRQAAPIEFLATLTDQGTLSMRGRMADEQMREAVASFAESRFDVTESGLRDDEAVPGGWTVRVIAALEAMDTLQSGSTRVTPDIVALTGLSGDPATTDKAAAILSSRLGAGARYQLAIRYDRRLDPALGLPDGEECVARLNRIMSESAIGFEPSKSTIAGDPGPTLEQLAEAMTDCADFQIEAGGHTDSQGSEGFNAELSRGRAQAIVQAMSEAGIDTVNMTSRGYGESQPIDTNETEAGREANRRIEFRLLTPRPVRSDALDPPVTISGVTRDPDAPVEAEPDRAAMQGPQLPPVFGPALPEHGLVPPRMQGPQLPHAQTAGMVPMTVGVSEEFETLDEREENIRVPVLTPDDDTPRPGARPESVITRVGEEQTDETPAE
ncbi:OmpA family protein [Paracoccus sp. 1_MG-2023]|uniref:OmpA family protein n=1 Tax=unclassified Paracoccus (in: a-proteobacteria) TaxID=2688777 RepID=UPI001C08FDF0|nr:MULTISPECIES: OmpA family protein [unclassified Paracoccus (in: a-proteobacteria)]MBU2956938.1 OmpA family protein [Paracoccus sp. C2R09]MDO6668136.1 OmpA family protein [Paracoccus sp. 1_MG-2023]